jgi:hypothetical protein
MDTLVISKMSVRSGWTSRVNDERLGHDIGHT